MSELKRTGFIFTIILLSLILGLSEAAFAGGPDTVRVAIIQGSTNVTFSVQGNYAIVIDNIPFLAGGQWSIIPDAGHMRVQGPGVNLLANSINLNEQYHDSNDVPSNLINVSNKGKKYRGSMTLHLNGGKITAVNILPMNEYLYGVVGAEIGAYAGIEALKAQAIVSRTYVAYHDTSSSNWRVKNEYGVALAMVDDGTSSQVYDGYSYEELAPMVNIRNAVNGTSGVIIKYSPTPGVSSSPILAVFHSNAGGYTEENENVWSGNLPYLCARPSTGDSYASSFSAPDSWPAYTYQWTKEFSGDQLKSVFNIGDILDITTNQPTSSGRVTEMRVYGSNGQKIYTKDGIRFPLNLRSTLFSISKLGDIKTYTANEPISIQTATGVSQMNANNLYVISGSGETSLATTYVVQGRNPLTYVFNGKGYGHGLGMSQWGARKMAEQDNLTAEQILNHYYQPDSGVLTIEP